MARLRPPSMDVGVTLQSKEDNEIELKMGRVMQPDGE
jgi:hypothetical protein